MLPVAHERTPDRRHEHASPPWDVQVTIVRDPPDHPIREWVAAIRGIVRARVIGLVVIAAVAGGGGVLVGAPHSAGAGPSTGARVAQRNAAGPAALEVVYRYPLGCLSAMSFAHHRAHITARFDRASPCWWYGVYVTAILRRVDGTRRLALEAVSPSCPAVPLPPLVRAQVAVCRREPTAQGAIHPGGSAPTSM